MPTFKYRATRQGEMINGQIKANSLPMATIKLKSQNLDPIYIIEKPLIPVFSKGGSVESTEIILMTRQLAFLISSGVPLIQSLDIILGLIKDPLLNSHMKDVLRQMRGGASFSKALRSKPHVFSGLYINMIVCGEETGNMENILAELSTYIEKSEAIKARVKSAMWYPIAVLLISFAIITGLLVFVVPKFQELYGNSGKALPWITQVFVNLSELVRNEWYFFIAGMILIPFFLLEYVKSDSGSKRLSEVTDALPLFGELNYKVGLSRFCRSFFILLQAGVNFLEALDIAKNISGHRKVMRGLTITRDSISQGKGFAYGLTKSKAFPVLLVSMAKIGEESGNVDKVFKKLTEFYEEEVDRVISGLIKLIEPLLMVFLGGIIGTVVLALYLPIFNMGDVMN